MQTTPNILEYYIDTSGYYVYLMFSPVQQASGSHILQNILAPLAQAVPALELTRVMGTSSRPANDGKHYTYYVRLSKMPNQQVLGELVQFLNYNPLPQSKAAAPHAVVQDKPNPKDPVIQRYKERLTKAKTYFCEMNDEIQTLKLDIQSLTTQNRRFSIENLCVKDEQKAISKKLTAIKNTHKKVKDERSKLRDDVGSLSHELEQTKIEIAEYQKANKHLVKKSDENLLKSLKAQLKKSTDLLIKKDSQVSQLRDEIEDLNTQIPTENDTGISEDLSAAEKLLEELEAEKNRLNDEIGKLKAKELEAEPPTPKPVTHIIKSIYGDRINFLCKGERLLFDHSTSDGIRMIVFEYIVWILHNTPKLMTRHEKIKSYKSWYKAHVSGEYRLYYRKYSSKNIDILFAPKADQPKSLKYLRKLDS